MVKVIGIGASAGGLEAIIAFFRTIKNEKVAYIIVQHLSDRTSIDTILQKKVKQKVVHVRNGLTIRPNHIYLNQPDSDLLVEGSKIRLEKGKSSTFNYPINLFFNSLAKNYREEALAIVLSGTGTDGTLGAIEVKSSGGLVLVQAPDTAKFDGMPNAIINNSAADYINSPVNLARFVNTLRLKTAPPSFVEEHYVTRILKHLEKASKIDFGAYKEATLSRRIKRRMQLLKIADHEKYLQKLKYDEEESHQLLSEFLIPVTSFFRDQEVFLQLECQILPKIILKAHEETRIIRIWVTGCSIGSEAYSIGMLLEEIQKKLRVKVQYKIFASDVDHKAISKANLGIYTISEISNLPKQYLSVYFQPVGPKEFRICHNLREHFLFLNHDLLSDPPLINMDLVSCRNLLIYFKKEFQLNLIKKFHFSLNNQGVLLLGKSESVSGLDSILLVETDKMAKVYEIKKSSRIRLVNFEPGRYQAPQKVRIKHHLKTIQKKNKLNTTEMNTSDNMYDLLLQEILPNYLVIDEDFEVIYNNVDIRGFFSMTKGSPTLNLLNMISPELSLILREAVNQVLNESSTLRLEAVEVESLHESDRIVDFILKPIINEKFAKKAVIIEVKPRRDKPQIIRNIDYSKDSLVKSLKQELEDTKRNLTQLEAKLEASNEELQSTNEELQSSNEELQSSNEELQSLNEELYSVNSELQERMKELSQLNEESNQLIEGAELGMVVIDQHSFVLKYTRTAKKLFNIKDEHPGKNIFSLEKNFEFPDFPQFINDGFKTSNIYEKEIKTYDDDHFTMRRIPLNNRLILLFLDINRVKDIDQLYQILFENSNDFVSIFDQETKVRFVNKFASESWHHENKVDSSILDNIPDEEQKKKVAASIRRMFNDGEPYEYYLKTKDPTGKKFVFHCKTHMIRQTKSSIGVLVSRDVTLEKQREYVLNYLTRDIADIILSIDSKGNIVSLSSKEEVAFQRSSTYYTKWDFALALYKDDKKTKFQDDENPLLAALKGTRTEKVDLHLASVETGEMFHLVGDFYPLQQEDILDGAIAYLYKK